MFFTSKILAVLMLFQLLNTYIVSYISDHLSFSSEQSHQCLIKNETTLLLFQEGKIALQPDSPPGENLFPTSLACGNHGCDSLWHNSWWLS